MGSDGDGLDWEGEVRGRSGCLDSGPEGSVNTEGGHGLVLWKIKVPDKRMSEEAEKWTVRVTLNGRSCQGLGVRN